MKTGLIYKYTNVINGKSYIGKSMEYRFKIRQKQHKNDTTNSHFAKAKRKYGYENFTLEVLENNIPKNLMGKREMYWIEKFDTFKNGYNSTKGGDGGDTFAKRTTEQMKQTSKKLSKANSGENNGMKRYGYKTAGENNGMYGKRSPVAKYVTLINVKTNETKTFENCKSAANFLGYKHGSAYSKMKKENLIINDWKIFKESVETTENIT